MDRIIDIITWLAIGWAAWFLIVSVIVMAFFVWAWRSIARSHRDIEPHHNDLRQRMRGGRL